MSDRIGLGCTTLVCCLLVFTLAASSPAETPLFPFVVSYDAPENATDVAGWIQRPAGRHGFVRAAEGHLATEAGPMRFWGTNLCFDACFPTHEQAEDLAPRLARLGFNCVRMHHMDARSIWAGSPNKRTISPVQLDKLDYLIHQLKLHGIYTNINLHVSRTLGPKEGFPGQDERPKYDKGLGNFEPRMIEAQKQYARDLLTHVNPYTKNAYTQEPAVAFVEISNEDSLFTEWNRGSLDALPEPYATTFRQLWNDWLEAKYGTTEKLRRAWNVGAHPLGDEMLTDADFSKPLGRAWRLQRDDQCEAQWSIENNGPEGGKSLRITVTRQGRVSWVPQLTQSGFAVRKGAPYTLACWLRSDHADHVSVNCMMDHEPWNRLGLSAQVDVGPEWRQHHFTFVAEKDDPDARVTVTGMEPGTYELAGVSLRPGGIVGLAPDECLEEAGVPVLRRRRMNLTAPARRDFVDFLWETEQAYWSGMYRFLKDDLGVKSLVSGTQLNYSPVHVQAALDYIDAHAYWNHPSFPGRPWDRRNWFVRNVPLVNSPGGTLSSLAVRRVSGMAYTVSEYNHPAPNVYGAEGFPMIAAFGRMQAWDGVFPFTYSHNDEFKTKKITSYFDVKSHPAKLVHMPACAALFLRGDAAPARRTLTVPLGRPAEREKLYETLNSRNLTADEFGLNPRLALMHAVALDLEGGAAADLPALADDVSRFRSDTGELRWDVSQPGKGYFIADTPNTKLFTGFVAGRTFELGDVALTVGTTRLDWATVSIVSLHGSGFAGPGRLLVAATGRVQNSGAELEELGGDRVTLRDRWGEEPSLCEGIPAEITLPATAGQVTFYPLDAAGNRREAVSTSKRNGRTTIALDPRHETLWYEVEIR